MHSGSYDLHPWQDSSRCIQINMGVCPFGRELYVDKHIDVVTDPFETGAATSKFKTEVSCQCALGCGLTV